MDKEINIKEILLIYKNATLNIIDGVMKDTHNPLTELWNTRNKCVEDIINLDYRKEDFKSAISELKIIEADNRLRETIGIKKKELMNNIHKLSNKNNGVMAYKKMQKNDVINRLQKL